MQPTPAARSAITPPSPELARLLHAGPGRAPVTLCLLVCNCLIFAAMLFNGAGLWHTSTAVPLAWGANFGPATQDGQWWRLFSALFLHFGIVHLALNMWALWDVGRLMEQVLGRWRFVLLYLGSGVIGNLLSLALQGNRAVSGGASGAIFSLYGALMVFLWRERRQVDPGEFRWFFGASVVFTLFALVMGQLVPGIDNAAHIGGLLAGALFGTALSRPWTAGSPTPRAARAVAATMLVLLSLALLLRIPQPDYRLGEELQARSAIRQFLVEDQRISRQWESILDTGRGSRQSFEQLAGQIDADVTAQYQENFEQLSGLHLDAAAPSARALEVLRNYAALRSSAAQELSHGLRSKDRDKILRALESARRAPELAQKTVPAQAKASAPGTEPAKP